MDTPMKKVIKILLLALFVVSILQPFQPAYAARLSAVDLTAPNAFGYQVTENTSPTLTSISTTGTPVQILSLDDGVIPLSIGFTFPFFENSYSDLWLSTNGFISFSDPNQSYPGNSSLPTSFKPNNMIAAFWDDLDTKGIDDAGKVYTQLIGTAPNRQYVIEYSQITKLGHPDPLTFQIVLKENGDIILNYLSMSGTLNEATIGIEDSDGVDGFTLLDNEDGLSSPYQLSIDRPDNGIRVKASPSYQGGFFTDGQIDLPLKITNTGTTSEKFKLLAGLSNGPAEWAVDFYNEAKSQAITETQNILPGSSETVYARVSTNGAGSITDYANITLTVESNSNPSIHHMATAQVTIPAPFVQVFVDANEGFVEYINATYRSTKKLFDYYPGANLTVQQTNNQGCVAGWETLRTESGSFIGNIKTSYLDPAYSAPTPPKSIQDYGPSTYTTKDVSPEFAVINDTNLGVVYVHLLRNTTTYKNITNIHFARLSQTGETIGDPTEITTNTEEMNDYESSLPSVAATSSKFMAAWQQLDGEGNRDIELAILNSTGAVEAQLTLFDSTSPSTSYSDPSLLALPNDQILITYFVYDAGTDASQLRYAVLTESGSIEHGPFFVSNTDGGGADAALFNDNNNVLIAWNNDINKLTSYLVIDTNGQIVHDAANLDAPDYREMEDVSVTWGPNGTAILTWRDSWYTNLYYAVVDSLGYVLTPAQIFKTASDPNSPNIFSSALGGGIAPLPENIYWDVFLPTVRR